MEIEVVEQGIDWPSWIQAIGTLVAIAIAILVPYCQRKNEVADRKEEKRLLRKSLALKFLPSAKESQRIAQEISDTDPKEIEDAILSTSHEFPFDDYKVPISLRENVEKFADAGKAGEHLQIAVYEMENLEEKIERAFMPINKSFHQAVDNAGVVTAEIKNRAMVTMIEFSKAIEAIHNEFPDQYAGKIFREVNFRSGTQYTSDNRS